MAGFTNDSNGDQIMYTDNVDFTGSATPSATVTANGQLLIGSSVAPHIRVNTLTAGPGISIVNGEGTITIASSGGSTNVDSFAMQSGTSPVVPDTTGLVTFSGGTAAAGTNPVITVGGTNTMTLTVQRAQAIAATDATKVGLCNFDSAKFTVDANGFVSTSGTGVGNTITGNDATVLSPSSGNWNIYGASGSKTSGSGSTLTVKSPPYADSTAATLTVNSGTFATAAGAYTLPAAPLVGDLVEVICITTGIVVTANAGQTVFLANDSTSVGGTLTNSAKSDVLCLRYRATDTSWYCTSSMGVWTLA